MKKLNYLLLAILLLVTGLVNVDAKTYTSYKKGDKITVNVNDTTKLDFYVIEDSSTENVTAIYEGVLGEEFEFHPTSATMEGSELETQLKELTSTWESPSVIRLVEAEEIIPGVNLEKDSDEDFKEPSYYHIGKTYFTQTILEGDEETFYSVAVVNWSVFSSLMTNGSMNGFDTAYIRPVITVAKDYVVGGIVEESGVEDPELKEENASTGDISMVAFAAGAVLLAGVAIVSYRKTKLD